MLYNKTTVLGICEKKNLPPCAFCTYFFDINKVLPRACAWCSVFGVRIELKFCAHGYVHRRGNCLLKYAAIVP